LGIKMSDFYTSVNNSQIRIIFFMKMVWKVLFIHLWSISIKLCFSFSKKISQTYTYESDFWSHPKMSGFFLNNVRDPRSQDPDFLELWFKCFSREFLFLIFKKVKYMDPAIFAIIVRFCISGANCFTW
jgi:hypothetical protein